MRNNNREDSGNTPTPLYRRQGWKGVGSGKGKAMKKKAASKRAAKPAAKKKKEDTSETWNLRLYVAGQTQKSIAAFANLTKICEKYVLCKYKIEVVDLLENPQLAKGDQILAVPTLVRKLPVPVRKIIGDLSNTERVLVGLDLRPAK